MKPCSSPDPGASTCHSLHFPVQDRLMHVFRRVDGRLLELGEHDVEDVESVDAVLLGSLHPHHPGDVHVVL